MTDYFTLFENSKVKNKTLLFILLGMTLSLLVSLESRATFNEDDSDSERHYSMGEDPDFSDYSEDDPYATFLNEQHIQERRINRVVENVSSFIRRSEEEIESVIKVALPLITSKKIIHSNFEGSHYSHIQYVCGRLCAKIIKALSEVLAEEREDIVELTALFYKKEQNQIFPNATFPHIIKSLSEVLKKDRKKVIELAYPFYSLYAEHDGFGFTNDYPALIIKAISNISEEERDNIIEQITPRIIKILPLFTKNCVFRTYSDGGDNGKRKHHHAEMIEIIAKVSKDDRASVLDCTFQRDSFVSENFSYKDHRGRTRSLEKSYADIDEIVLKKMKVIKAIPAHERTDILERIKLLMNEERRDDYFIEVLEALSKFSKDQRDSILIEALLKKKRGEDFLPFLIAISKIPENQRTDIWGMVEEMNKKFKKGYGGYSDSRIVQTLARIPEDQRKSVINDSLRVFLSSERDKVFDDPSTLMEIISKVSEENRQDVLEKVEILLSQKSISCKTLHLI